MALMEFKGRDDGGLDSQKKIIPWHFFKIILPSTIEDKKLVIPKKFIKMFGDEHSAFATLTVPNGRAWQVGLNNLDGDFWFTDGWPEFVKSYSLGVGNFLVFRYEGNSSFHVIICDLTACEIHYELNDPSSNKESSDGKNCSTDREKEMQIDGPVEMLETMGPSLHIPINNGVCNGCFAEPEQRKRCDAQSQQNQIDSSIRVGEEINKQMRSFCSSKRPLIKNGYKRRRKEDKMEGHVKRPQINYVYKSKKEKLNKNKIFNSNGSSCGAADLQVNDSKFKKTVDLVVSHSSDELSQRNDSEYKEGVEMYSTRYYRTQEMEGVIPVPGSFKTENPSFMVKLRPTYTNILYIPTKFAKKYLVHISKHIILQDSDGREWPVKCVGKNNHLFLSRGWNQFLMEKKLEESDVCIFELIEMNEFVFKVSIFRAVEYASPGILDSTIPSLPYYSLDDSVFNPSESKGESSKRYDASSEQDLEMNKCCRHVGVMDQPNLELLHDSRSKMDKTEEEIGNMDRYAKESRTHKSDKQGMLWLDKTGENESLPMCGEDVEIITSAMFEVALQKSSPESKRAVHDAKMLRLKNPSFMLILRRHNILGNFLYVPAEFAQSYLREVPDYIKLQASDGKEWPVGANWRGRRLTLVKGWNNFCRENNLKEGDVCLFELIKSDNMLKVSVFHAVPC